MRTWLVVAVLLSVLASPMLTKTPILEDLDDNLQHSSPIQAIISPSSGLTTGGEEITITGSGFLDMAWKNLTSDGNAYTWTTTTANYVYQSGWDPSIGVDSNGTVHIAHSNLDSDDFWLSSYDGSTWTHLKIRNCGTCSNADLVIDSNDNIHIAYYHSISGTGYLLYTMYDGTSWSNNWSTSNAENDQISIALDANDRPHISYSREGYICNAALLTYYDGSSWTTVTLDATTTYVGCDSSIAIDSNGFVHVAYRHHGNMDMKIASNISGTWQRYLVDNGNGVGYHSAMAVDSNDELHLVYASNSAGNTAYFADGASGSAWTVSNQGNSRNTFSMYIDQFDIVHISEYNGNSNLGYSMVAPGGTRQSMTVDNVGDVGYENDIVVDENNMVHIAYYDTSNKLLKYANRSTGMSITQEITVQFGNYGYVTGQVVNDTTIIVNTPIAGTVAETVDVSLWDLDGIEHVLNSSFSYISPDDLDSDGVINANDDCPNIAGTSTQDLNGCPDDDSDGYSNSGDAFPNEPSQWNDTDGDGCGDRSALLGGSNADAFPLDSTQCLDSDNDGYGDNQTGFQPDACITTWGNSTKGRFGCLDDDGDGWANLDDVFPLDATEHNDTDGDGVGDNSDWAPNDATESHDSDGDGVGDNSDDFSNDASETQDTDGDGIGDNADAFPLNANEWEDLDGNQIPDNSEPSKIQITSSSQDLKIHPYHIYANNLTLTLDVITSEGFTMVSIESNPSITPNTGGLPYGMYGGDSQTITLESSQIMDQIPSEIPMEFFSGDYISDSGPLINFTVHVTGFPHGCIGLPEYWDTQQQTICPSKVANYRTDYYANFSMMLWNGDDDNDGVANSWDLFPLDANESQDSDGDGVGDNSDEFPNDPSESVDTDGDGVGDNSDAFPNDTSESMDTDGDGVGDIYDLCINTMQNNSVDTDGCSQQQLNSDGNETDDSQGNQTNGTDNTNQTEVPIDTDGDGVSDLEDNCPGTSPDTLVDAFGCEIVESENDEDESTSAFESFFSGDSDPVTTTVGVGAILLALFTLLQTNAVAAVLPDAFRWVQVLRKNSKLTKEERNELTYLQSIVQAYYSNPEDLAEELVNLKGDITARFTNNQIKKETREKLLILIAELQTSTPNELYQIAHNEAYFGLSEVIDTDDRTKLLDEKLAMSASENNLNQPESPSQYSLGEMDDKGTYWIEYPEDSGVWHYRYAPEDDWAVYEN